MAHIHINRALQHNPSIFEIYAAETLDITCYPALSRVVQLLDERFSDEIKGRSHLICLLINGILQYYYLRRNNSSFGEFFYGIQRSENTSPRLTQTQKILSLISLVIVPFLEKREQDELQTNSPEPMHNRLLHYVKKILSVNKLIRSVQMFSYLAHFSRAHSPFMQGTNMKLVYAQHTNAQEHFSYYFLKILHIGTFFLQFIQWWHTTPRRRPPHDFFTPPPRHAHLEKAAKFVGICPICLEKPVLKTAISVSGFVYCLRCISQHLENKKTCPVTNYSADFSDLVRIYDDS